MKKKYNLYKEINHLLLSNWIVYFIKYVILQASAFNYFLIIISL